MSVSGPARELARLRASLGSVGEVRDDRVVSLRTAGDGRYDADPTHVARSFLVDVLGDLLAS